MAEVVGFPGKKPAPRNVIERLEGMLEEARTGEIRSIAYIVVKQGNRVGYGFETDTDFEHAHIMVAGSVYLQKQLENNAAAG